MPKFICNKLSRDKTLENMKNAGILTTHTFLEGKALFDALNQKLVEECHEVVEAQNKQEMISELADVFDVISGFCTAHGISSYKIKEAQQSRCKERGGFEKGIFVETIEMEDTNIWVSHFRKSPEKYPEI